MLVFSPKETAVQKQRAEADRKGSWPYNMSLSLSERNPLGIGARLGVLLVRGYQLGISPFLPSSCRYYPSCSEYTLHAIAHRGLVRGVLLGAWRILRCNPFSRGGYDPGPWAAEEEQR